MPYMIVSWCGSYDHKSHSYDFLDPTKGSECLKSTRPYMILGHLLVRFVFLFAHPDCSLEHPIVCSLRCSLASFMSFILLLCSLARLLASAEREVERGAWTSVLIASISLGLHAMCLLILVILRNRNRFMRGSCFRAWQSIISYLIISSQDSKSFSHFWSFFGSKQCDKER